MKQQLIAWLMGLVLSTGVAWAGAGEMTIIYSGNTDGELEPCGCSEEGNLGGILRRATTIDKLRRQHPDLFLVSSGGLLASISPQDRLTGEYILKGLAQVNYDALGVQWQDLAYGDEFILHDGLHWVSSNHRHAGVAKERLIRRGGQLLAFFSWLDPEKDPAIAMGEGRPVSVSRDTAELAQSLKAAQASGALTLLATSLPLAQAREQLPLEQVDILVVESAYEEYGEPQKIGNLLVLQPGSRGMRLGHLTLERGTDGRIAAFRHEVIKMPKSVEDAERLLPWYKEYNAKVKETYLVRAAQRRAAESGDSPYAGEEACATCHADEHDIWWDTPHAGAYDKLEDVNKAYDPNCVGCHTVGYDQPGGFIDMDTTPQFAGVQCESCHGAAREHVRSAGSRPVANASWEPQQMCAQCHVQKHSPAFNFDRYWPRIRHGLAK